MIEKRYQEYRDALRAITLIAGADYFGMNEAAAMVCARIEWRAEDHER